MPLTEFQRTVAQLIAPLRTPESHLAGGAAIHLTPQSKRYSNDLDYFHDSAERVGEAFAKDRQVLVAAGFEVIIQMNQPGFMRALVSKGNDSTKLEWSHDSAWRFMPAIPDELVGFRLHPIDLAINKLLALAGRDEPRDFLDIIWIHQELLHLGMLCWAAVGKDPGFTPLSLLELIRRRGKYRPEDFTRLKLTTLINLPELKATWLAALDAAEGILKRLPPDQIGCLYYSKSAKKFVIPDPATLAANEDIVPHHGRPGGVLPRFLQSVD